MLKTKEKKSLRSKELKDIKKLLEKKRLELKKIKVKILTGKEKNLKAIKHLKKEIAQIITILKEKEMIKKHKKL